MIYTYYSINSMLTMHLQTLQKELADARNDVSLLLPQLEAGRAGFCTLDRKNMEMIFSKADAERMKLPDNFWVIEKFRKICAPDCLDVFEKWIGQYVYLFDPVNRRLRFHLTLDGGKTYQWWELIYALDEKTRANMFFYALLVNIDPVIDIESAIDDARNRIYHTELKQTFLASINHDLRTPINAIAGFASLLVEQYDDLSEEDRMQFADIVEENSNVLLQLLADINDVNLDDIEKIKFKPRNKSVSELINLIYQTNKVICPSHLKFSLDVDEKQDDKTIFVDAKRVEQVINNFLSNSFKFTRTGFVKLGWKYISETNEVEMFVTDTGIGIKKENFDNLFDRFFKIHEHANGTGLGLNICKNIVEKQDGTIGVDSVYGKGSTFYCRFKESPTPALPEGGREK